MYVKSYKSDGGIDVVLPRNITLTPGINNIELPHHYTPRRKEYAILVARSSIAQKGIFPISSVIDTNYTGCIHAMIVNVNNYTVSFDAGERIFSIVNAKSAKDRVKCKVLKKGKRNKNWNGSSGR